MVEPIERIPLNTDDNDQSNDNIITNDVDYFPWQDKQPVLPQDILPIVPNTTAVLPSLTKSPIETFLDKTYHAYANTTKTTNNNDPTNDDKDNNDDDVDCHPVPGQDKQPILFQQDTINSPNKTTPMMTMTTTRMDDDSTVLHSNYTTHDDSKDDDNTYFDFENDDDDDGSYRDKYCAYDVYIYGYTYSDDNNDDDDANSYASSSN